MRKIKPVLVTFYSISLNQQILFRGGSYSNIISTIYPDLVHKDLLHYNVSHNILLDILRHTKEITYETN